MQILYKITYPSIFPLLFIFKTSKNIKLLFNPMDDVNFIILLMKISQQKGREPIKALFCSPPLAGHYIPMLNIIEQVAKDDDFEVEFAISQYYQQKIKFKSPKVKRLNLKDTVNTLPQRQWDHIPFYYFDKDWYDQLDEYVKNQKPQVLICDIFATAIMKIGHKYKIPTVINLGFQQQIIGLFDFPMLKRKLSFLGVNFLYCNFFRFILPKILQQLFVYGYYLDKSLVLVHSVNGLNQANSIPPNFKFIGSAKNLSPSKPEFQKDLSQWIETRRLLKKDIIYLTFGSHLALNKRFIDFLYEGLKKIDISVIWSLKEGSIPEENDNFFVRKWLPQEDILKLSEVKVVITHCGWGAVTECIQAKKPMLCVPGFADQMSNSQLVERKGLGLILRKPKQKLVLLPALLDEPRYTHEQLSQKINILRKQTSFISNLNKINRLLGEGGGAPEAKRHIKNAALNGIDHLIDKNIQEIRSRSIAPLVLLGLGIVGGIIYKSGVLRQLKNN